MKGSALSSESGRPFLRFLCGCATDPGSGAETGEAAGKNKKSLFGRSWERTGAGGPVSGRFQRKDNSLIFGLQIEDRTAPRPPAAAPYPRREAVGARACRRGETASDCSGRGDENWKPGSRNDDGPEGGRRCGPSMFPGREASAYRRQEPQRPSSKTVHPREGWGGEHDRGREPPDSAWINMQKMQKKRMEEPYSMWRDIC